MAKSTKMQRVKKACATVGVAGALSVGLLIAAAPAASAVNGIQPKPALTYGASVVSQVNGI